jgi:hypothetical protein
MERGFSQLKFMSAVGVPPASQYPCKTTGPETNKHEKHFKVSHNKESHKVKVLARIYFSITA